MYTYVRSTKLSDIRGRSDYITNKTGKHAAEDVLCVGGPTSDWLPYANYERTHQRSSERNNEGRELIVALPNSWGSGLAKPFLKGRIENLAQKLLGKDTDYQFAVHWNGSHTNLHAHIIFSERTRAAQNEEKWDRDIYLTADGKVARKKADRAVNADGTVKPPVHRKGEPKNAEFTLKDKKYKSKEWLQSVKKAVAHTFTLDADKKHVTNYLHTFHEGKAPQAAERIKKVNEIIRSINKWLDEKKSEGYVLKKAGDTAYYELYKRAVGNIKDDQSIDDWFLSNIALNADKIKRKQDNKAQKELKAEEKRIAKERKAQETLQERKNTAIQYLNSLVFSDIYSLRRREGGVYEHMEAHLNELGLKCLDTGTYEKYQNYVNKYLSDGEQRAYRAEMVKTIASRSKPDSIYQAGTAKILNKYIESHNLDVAPISELNQVEQERQRRRKEAERQRRQSGRGLNDLILYAEKKKQEEKVAPQQERNTSQDISPKRRTR